MHRFLRKYMFKRMYTDCSGSFNKWKNFSLKAVEERQSKALASKTTNQGDFDEFFDKVQETNNARVFKHIMDTNKTNIWRAWNNVIYQIKLTKSKTVEFQERQLKMKKQFALQRWQKRNFKTKFCRARETQLVASFRFKYHRACFLGWKQQYLDTKRFLNSMSNLERLMRERNNSDAFKNIRAVAVSKGLVMRNRRQLATKDIMQLMQQAYLKNINAEFQRYKKQVASQKEYQEKLKSTFGKASTYRLRDAFEQWKKRHSLMELRDDLHYCGPVRAEYWEANKEINNLKEFMRKERFTENEIEKTFGEVCKTNDGLLKKYVTRLRLR